jgi:adenine phosphoribosyltransferase
MTLQEHVFSLLKDIPDFPKPGIVFKDIMPLFRDPILTKEIAKALAKQVEHLRPDIIAGIESRGFLLGPLIAQELDIPFICVRKKGKLPGRTISVSYELEYGNAEIEIQEHAVKTGDRILIHDDVLATGGTAEASKLLFEKASANVIGYLFLLEIKFLGGAKKIHCTGQSVHTFVTV